MVIPSSFWSGDRRIGKTVDSSNILRHLNFNGSRRTSCCHTPDGKNACPMKPPLKWAPSYNSCDVIEGACCELKDLRHAEQKSEKSDTSYQDLRRLQLSSKQLIDWCLYLPQISLWIDLPNNMEDIHSFGEMLHKYNGLHHCVLCIELVVMCGQEGAYHKPFSTHPAWKSREVVFIPDFEWTGKPSNKMVHHNEFLFLQLSRLRQLPQLPTLK